MGGGMATGAVEPYGREGLNLEDARHTILESLKGRSPLPTERMPLKSSLGRVCALDAIAAADVPGFRASIMDGYALAQITQPEPSQRWTLQGLSAPGQPYVRPLNRGEAIRILTGAPLPEGAHWVLPQEVVTVDDGILHLDQRVSDQSWIRAADEECRQGDVLIERGKRLTAADLGRLASCGIQSMHVHRSPRIGLLITGDELVPAGARRPPGSIWESNSMLLGALLNNLNQTITDLRVVADQPDQLKQALEDLAQHCDVIVSTGGISAGDSDWIRTVVEQIGTIAFWKLFLKPGRPFAYGTLNTNIPFFGLPGNPVAAAITALQLLWPALQLIEGQQVPETFPRLRVRLAAQLQRRPGRPELARARLHCNADGDLFAELDGSQASSRIGSLAHADLLLEIPAEADRLPMGSELWAQLIRRPLF